jgi:hypothetical protein
MLERERDETHTFRLVDMCKLQMDDPKHEWSPRYQIAHGWKIWVWICHQVTWALMRQKEPRSIFILFFYCITLFPSHFSLFLFILSSSFFPYISFLLIIFFFIFHFFSFCSSELLQHNTYIAFVRDDVMTPPPCFNDARPRNKRGGKWLLK